MIDRMTYELGQGTGPLRGVKVVEIAGIGPGPHACMILADLGADVIRVDRPGGNPLSAGEKDLLNRGRPSVALDLKRPEAVAAVLDLVERADVLVEGMRPGAVERLGLGPEDCWARNPRLVFGRMTGWGQEGPWAEVAGHDMNYIGISGALHGLGQDRSRPHFPSNLLGDFGGGSTYVVIGVHAALLAARASGTAGIVRVAEPTPSRLLAVLDDGASGVLVPSRYEGFGLPALEALQRGCPVAVARSGSLPEVVGEESLVDPDDVTAWTDAMQALLSMSEAERSARVARGHELAARFSRSRTADGLLAAYRAALTGDRSPS